MSRGHLSVSVLEAATQGGYRFHGGTVAMTPLDMFIVVLCLGLNGTLIYGLFFGC
ncbi:MAG: hypothetical protein RX316_08460 [bacterium]|nr:hypothetical protein [bacterium]